MMARGCHYGGTRESSWRGGAICRRHSTWRRQGLRGGRERKDHLSGVREKNGGIVWGCVGGARAGARAGREAARQTPSPHTKRLLLHHPAPSGVFFPPPFSPRAHASRVPAYVDGRALPRSGAHPRGSHLGRVGGVGGATGGRGAREECAALVAVNGKVEHGGVRGEDALDAWGGRRVGLWVLFDGGRVGASLASVCENVRVEVRGGWRSRGAGCHRRRCSGCLGGRDVSSGPL
jgi:hypothetical protein